MPEQCSEDASMCDLHTDHWPPLLCSLCCTAGAVTHAVCVLCVRMYIHVCCRLVEGHTNTPSVFPFPLCVQYEFKVKGIKKIRCHIYMSLEGAKVTRRKRNRVRQTHMHTYVVEFLHVVS